MFTITLCNTKGGSGKTTMAKIIADSVHAMGYRAHVIEADPARNLTRWRDYRVEEGRGEPYPIELELDPERLPERVRDLRDAEAADVLVIDPEGSHNKLLFAAVSQTDLALIPLNVSYMDADQAARTATVIRKSGFGGGPGVPFVLAFTNWVTTMSKAQYAIRDNLARDVGQVMDEPLRMLAAYKEVFDEGLMLSELPNRTRAATAIKNADRFVRELFDLYERIGPLEDAA